MNASPRQALVAQIATFAASLRLGWVKLHREARARWPGATQAEITAAMAQATGARPREAGE